MVDEMPGGVTFYPFTFNLNNYIWCGRWLTLWLTCLHILERENPKCKSKEWNKRKWRRYNPSLKHIQYNIYTFHFDWEFHKSRNYLRLAVTKKDNLRFYLQLPPPPLGLYNIRLSTPWFEKFIYWVVLSKINASQRTKMTLITIKLTHVMF